ncbi:hypothetical protein D9757_013520 [Collybiopsis confluens]|uniref:Uncharacterized protein n=1 Tax=Collybiopsis confluens TaxID=2823264 RepID=A0A8H5G1A4_9AGAR|nr:hypothetical protein D9757_013520 [Collybiopsis confluens]
MYNAHSNPAAIFVPDNGRSAHFAIHIRRRSALPTRSTSGIVWSCITTIFACTWVAVHPNVPSVYDSDMQLFWRRVKILTVALIAPEFIIIWAANHLRSATKSLNKLSRFEAFLFILSGKHWSVAHGMFLITGGFVLTDASGKYLQVLQEDNLAELLSKDFIVLPHITESEITDRGKRDTFAKILVLIQTSWFIAQVTSRAASHLPITELELTTVAFALLNFLTYAIWWKKPLDARFPLRIALRAGNFDFNSVIGAWGCSERHAITSIASTLRFADTGCDTLILDLDADQTGASATTLGPSEGEESEGCIPTKTQCGSDKENSGQKTTVKGGVRSDTSTSYIKLGRAFLFPVIREKLMYNNNVPIFHAGSQSPFLDQSLLHQMTPMILGMLVGTVFGSIHWAFPFPSKLERDLWRIMSLCISAAPLTMMIVVFIAWKVPHAYVLIKANRLILPVYIIGRLTILVPAFVLLRELPDGTFEEVQWTTFIPHV